MAEHTKDFNQAKSDFITALLESINGMSRVKTEQQLSSVISERNGKRGKDAKECR
jgi:hypothetical protein